MSTITMKLGSSPKETLRSALAEGESRGIPDDELQKAMEWLDWIAKKDPIVGGYMRRQVRSGAFVCKWDDNELAIRPRVFSKELVPCG